MLWKLEYNAIKNTINLGVTDDRNRTNWAVFGDKEFNWQSFLERIQEMTEKLARVGNSYLKIWKNLSKHGENLTQ